MTIESLERLKMFVSGHRHASVLAATHARQNGYKSIAAEHDNEAQLALLILKDLELETGDTHARKEAYDEGR